MTPLVSSLGWAVLIAAAELLQVSAVLLVLARLFHICGASAWTTGLVPLCCVLPHPPEHQPGPVHLAEARVAREQIELNEASGGLGSAPAQKSHPLHSVDHNSS